MRHFRTDGVKVGLRTGKRFASNPLKGIRSLFSFRFHEVSPPGEEIVVGEAFAKDVGADFIIKGLRAISDFENEMAQAQMNLNVSGVHTVFLPSTSANAAIASKYIRDIARFGGDVSSMVPVPVAKRIRKKFVKP